MLVDRGVRDRVNRLVSFTATNASTREIDVYVPSYPQRVRIRKLDLVVYQGTDQALTYAVSLVVNKEGLARPVMNSIPNAPANTVVSFVEAPADVVWTQLGCSTDVNSPNSAGEGIFKATWFGDGRVIEFKEGDELWMLARSSVPNVLYGWLHIDIDIL